MAVDNSRDDPDMPLDETEDAVYQLLTGSESYDDALETVYDNLGLGAVSHFYGIAKREEQFQELYQSFRSYSRFMDFRDGNRRKEKAYNEFKDSFENYMGELEPEEEANAQYSAAQASVDPEIFNGLANMIGDVTEKDMRDLLDDIRKTMNEH